MRSVTEEKLHEIVRAWLRDHVKAAGGMRRLGAATGIHHPQISNSLDEESGGQVSWRMLALISDMPGMSMARVFDQLAGRCAAIESANQKTVSAGPVPASTAEAEAEEARQEIASLRDASDQAARRTPTRTRPPRKT